MQQLELELKKCPEEAAVEFLTCFFNKSSEWEVVWKIKERYPHAHLKRTEETCGVEVSTKRQIQNRSQSLWAAVQKTCQQRLPQDYTVYALGVLIENHKASKTELYCVFVHSEKKKLLAGKYVSGTRQIPELEDRSESSRLPQGHGLADEVWWESLTLFLCASKDMLETLVNSNLVLAV